MTYERQRVPSITQLDYSPITGVSRLMCNTHIIDSPRDVILRLYSWA